MSNPKNSKQAPAKAAAPVSLANEARGEVDFRIGDKALLLVPSYENIAKLERALDSAYTDVMLTLAEQSPRFRMSHFVPVILSFNEGDEVDANEISLWVRTNIELAVQLVTRICIAVLDPEGVRYTSNSTAEAGAESPNA